MCQQTVYCKLLLLIILPFSLAAKEPEGLKKNRKQARAAGCLNTTAQVDLDINNVRARILNGGDLWWDPVGQIPYFEVPKGSGKNSLFAGAIWIAGYDNNGQLKAAAQTYRQFGANDFWAGPISKDPASGAIDIAVSTCEQYDRIWSIAKDDVNQFVRTGIAADVIKEWPGNGNVALGQSAFLAPFIDSNNDGIYNYADGDYPAFDLSSSYPPVTGSATDCKNYLMGDKNLWWVFNDIGNMHTETHSPESMGLEVHAQAFAFRTTDELNNMTFYNYKLINRSNNTLNDTYFGQWVDPDLGNAADDYVGSDVGLGMGYCFNGDDEDEGANGYGFNPPAIGVDFIQGPVADPFDGIDNNMNGVTDETGEIINMSHLMWYDGLAQFGEPSTLDDYYQHLTGIWNDGLPLTYGGTGRDQNQPVCNYMFPGTTDPAFPGQNWTMSTAGISPTDIRFIMSTGKFTLQPGGVNTIITAVIWARADKGGPMASLELLRVADRKAQTLFDNCFNALEGPHAPDIAIRELDQKIIVSLENTDGIEGYNVVDPFLPSIVYDTLLTDLYDTLSEADRSYLFQGYKVYQVADETVGLSELNDASKARLIKQIDIKDDIYKIINFKYDPVLAAWIPTQVADSNSSTNQGIVHDLVISTDYFTGQSLINYKPYYYTAVAYAYNNYRSFNPSSAAYSQPVPYKESTSNVKVYSAIPHKNAANAGGTVIHAEVNQSLMVKRIEGQGNGGNILDLSKETNDEILAGGISHPFAERPVYIAGAGPVSINIYDPVRVRQGDFALTLNGVTSQHNWFLTSNDFNDTIETSTFPIGILNSQLVPSHAVKVSVLQEDSMEFGMGSEANGFLGATITANNWIDWLADDKNVLHAGSQFDWIRSAVVTGNPDPLEVYENILGGKWAPVKVSNNSVGKGIKPALSPFDNFARNDYLASVDIVLTADKSKWTRALVVEMAAANAVNGSPRHEARRQLSIDKNGKTVNEGALNDGSEEAANYISDSSMGWFPGYAINIETGERLNIVYGENSAKPGQNGDDMRWNPTDSLVDFPGDTVLGGMHFVWVFGHNENGTNDVPYYDGGAQLVSKLLSSTPVSNVIKRTIWKDAMWNAIPLGKGSFKLTGEPGEDVHIRLRVHKAYRNYLAPGMTAVNGGNPYYEFAVPESLTVKTGDSDVASSAMNSIRVVPNPYYAYSTYERTRDVRQDNRVRITNLPSACTVSIYNVHGTFVRQLKRNVEGFDVSAGQEVVNGEDLNLSSTLDWDLKNHSGTTVASGVYYIHINAGVIGEKIIKWLGVMRDGDIHSK